MSGWQYIILGLSLLLLVYLLWLELKRVNKSRLLWRVLAVLVAVGALVCLEIPPHFRGVVGADGGGAEGVLLTEGADADSLRMFFAGHGSGLRVINADTLDRGNASVFDGLRVLHVFGHGLPRADWEGLGVLPRLEWHASLPGTGLASVSWERRVRPGAEWQVQGRIFRAAGGAEARPRATNGLRDSPKTDVPLKILLEGFHTSLDSLLIDGSKELTEFSLHTIPAQRGRAVYRLVILSGKDTLEVEDLPVEVMERQTARVLMLAAAPGPEHRFLADWLSRQGYSVGIRTAISKDKYDKSWLNMPEVSLDPIDASLLGRFDLVIADEEQLQALAPGALGVLRRSVAERGLGLIVNGDSVGRHGFYREPFVLLSGRDSVQGPSIQDRQGVASLLRDSLSRTIAARTLYGKGKLVYSVGQSTYHHILAGEQAVYGRWWSVMLGAAVAEEVGGGWSFRPERPTAGEAVQVAVQRDGNELEAAQVGETAVYLAEDPLFGFVRTGRYWPERAGWQRAVLAGRDSSWLYVWGDGDWRVQRGIERWMDTRVWMTGRRDVIADAGQKRLGVSGRPVEVGRVWFFALFLLAAGFLWVERKI